MYAASLDSDTDYRLFVLLGRVEMNILIERIEKKGSPLLQLFFDRVTQFH